jgi:TolB-like protein/DNA-binding winged helix-turn-helix (wHTH) protein/Tfp pilus assembly protein PilF
MIGPAPAYSRVRFGPFEFDPQTGELRKSGVLLHLPPQPSKVLALLVSHPSRLVTREEIQHQVWGDDTVVDFEHGLNFAIKKIRDTLGDDPATPRYIETLSRRGHRFIASVETVAAIGASTNAVAEITPSVAKPAASLTKRWGMAGAAGLFVTLVATLAVLNVAGLRNRVLTAILSKGAAAQGPRIESVAVLPFENLSGDPAQDYFADGMTEELVTSLGEVSELRVISRTSVMRFKGSRKPLPEIARELGVDAIVEGTVTRSGNHVRVTANLLHAATDHHLWANSYESELEDVLALQGNVARSIATTVRNKLLSPEPTQLTSPRRVNPEAYEAYLKGKYYTSKWTEEGFKEAITSFRQSLDSDPTYAPAYAGLADVYNWMAMWGLQPSTETYPTAKAAALKALELDKGLADAHAVLGQINLAFDWDWAGAEQELKRSIVLNPNSSTAHFYYGLFLTAMGRSDEAIKETGRALELDPLTPSSNLQLGWVLYYANRHDESIAQLRKTLAQTPDFPYANMELGWNYVQKGMYQEAVAECQRAVSRMPDEQVTLGSCGRVYGLSGRRRDALALVDRLKKASTRGYVDPYNVAMIYDGLDDDDHAFEWLDRAYRERSASLYGLRVDTWSERLRSDGRFRDLLRRMNFPPQVH